MTRYGFFCFLSRIFLRLLFRARVAGLEHIPASGAFIIAPNHISFLDPPAAGAFVGREIHYMARESLFCIPMLGSLISWCNAFPVHRGGPGVKAVRKALNVLGKGHGLLVFPQGRRDPLGRLDGSSPGVGMLSYRAGVPVIPVLIRGTEKALPVGARFIRFAGISVLYLAPVVPSGRASHEAYKKLADEVMNRLRSKQKEIEACRRK